ncbi:MAG: hypothetical protein RIR26_390 [Pseudomonadota bacterium]|jgi:hypothetical protein
MSKGVAKISGTAQSLIEELLKRLSSKCISDADSWFCKDFESFQMLLRSSAPEVGERFITRAVHVLNFQTAANCKQDLLDEVSENTLREFVERSSLTRRGFRTQWLYLHNYLRVQRPEIFGLFERKKRSILARTELNEVQPTNKLELLLALIESALKTGTGFSDSKEFYPRAYKQGLTPFIPFAKAFSSQDDHSAFNLAAVSGINESVGAPKLRLCNFVKEILGEAFQQEFDFDTVLDVWPTLHAHVIRHWPLSSVRAMFNSSVQPNGDKSLVQSA